MHNYDALCSGIGIKQFITLCLVCVQIVDAQAWHLNSDEPVSLDYNTVWWIWWM
jgi:hypothetical protein